LIGEGDTTPCSTPREALVAERSVSTMPRYYLTPKEQEQFLIREFFHRLGYTISRAKWQERPDALMTLRKGNRIKRAAIEHTDYYNDAVPRGGSPLAAVDTFWRKVQGSLVRRISQRQHLGGVEGQVTLTSRLPTGRSRTESARQLAQDIVDFLEAHPIAQGHHRQFSCRDFGEHPTLQSLVGSLSLHRRTDRLTRGSRCSWTCLNLDDGSAGLDMSYIKSAIEGKTRKAEKYNWEGAEEKWLLIVAPAFTLSNRVGGPPSDREWRDAELIDLCRHSPFDRIVFWERARSWYKCLKPDCRTVEFAHRKTH
jgi:hypothetical protein